MSRLSKIPKNQDLISVIKLSILEFNNEHNTTNLHFASKLHFTSSYASIQFNNLLQPFNEKYLKLDELLLLCDNLGTHSKHILDFLCDRYGYVCSLKASNETDTKNENIKDLLLAIGGSNGSLFSDYLCFNSDYKLDKKEIRSLLGTAYRTRALINQFETDLKEMLKVL